MESFDAKKATQLLREVFDTREIAEALSITRQEVENVIYPDAVELIQKERLGNLDIVKKFKEDIEKLFPKYRFSARLKSLPSIFGKALRRRTLADVFGIKVIVDTIKECYVFKEWLEKNYTVFDFDDRIKNPKPNGYRDLKIVIIYQNILIEFIIQTPKMYVDSHTIQKHSIVFPWKYHDVIKNLPAEYEYIEF